MRKLTGTFVAQDAEGRAHTIKIYTDITRIRTFNEPAQELEGLPDYVMANGGSITRLEQGKYQVQDTGALLTSTAPDAP